MKKLLEIFQESNGNMSSMRIMSFEIVSAACIIAVYLAVAGKVSVETAGMVAAMLTIGLTGKAVQKGQENKPEGSKTQEGRSDVQEN